MQIPYGIHDYKTIKIEDYLFVDKTEFIKKIEKIDKYLVFLRPRRFGKSLFTSMLYYYYDANSKDLFERLFHDTYIGKNKTKEANSYYVLKFDFSGISTENELIRTSFFRKIQESIDSFIEQYKLNIAMDSAIFEANEYANSFFAQFKSAADRQIYVIIDEYDHFANNILTTDLDLFNAIVGKDGFVRSFYEVLKEYAGTVIGRMFITGVTPITLDSLTSGFNNASNVSKERLLNEMMGFTENELIDVLDNQNIPMSHIQTLRENYNGYLFNEDSETRVYNSNMVLYYLRSLALYNVPPKNLADPNIVSDYTKITRMFDLYQDSEDKKEIIHDILNSEQVNATIIDKFSLRTGFSRDYFLSLMYYLGLLTINDSYGSISNLKTPNYIIKAVYFEYYFHYLTEMFDARIDVSKVNNAVYKLSFNNDPSLLKVLLEEMLNKLSGRDFIKFDEKYIKLLMVTYFSLSQMYLVKSEYEVENRYIDVVLLPNHVCTMNHYFIFEVKYISKSKYSDSLLDRKRNEAVEQIRDYGRNKEMEMIPNLRKYVFVFVHDECRVMEEV